MPMTIGLDTALALELYMRLAPECVSAAQHQAKQWLEDEARRLIKLEPGVQEVLLRILANDEADSVPKSMAPSVGFSEMNFLKE